VGGWEEGKRGRGEEGRMGRSQFTVHPSRVGGWAFTPCLFGVLYQQNAYAFDTVRQPNNAANTSIMGVYALFGTNLVRVDGRDATKNKKVQSTQQLFYSRSEKVI